MHGPDRDVVVIGDEPPVLDGASGMVFVRMVRIALGRDHHQHAVIAVFVRVRNPCEGADDDLLAVVRLDRGCADLRGVHGFEVGGPEMSRERLAVKAPEIDLVGGRAAAVFDPYIGVVGADHRILMRAAAIGLVPVPDGCGGAVVGEIFLFAAAPVVDIDIDEGRITVVQ
ncbi:MAG: hypothetical protein G8D61_01675, partial [gamma proteobacterium symbiont of Ctena orbiculata]